MRKLFLITAIVLVSASANAGPSRNLSLASSEPPQAAEQPNSDQTADTPSAAIERPKLLPPQEQAKDPVAADKPEVAAKPKTKRVSTEARVIYELHRHGIYW